MEAIIAALISAGLSLIGVVLTVRASNNKIMSEIKEHNAVQDERISNLTEEVRKHNSFAERVPVLETRFQAFEARMNDIDDRVKELERSRS